MTDNLFATIDKTIEQYQMLQKGDRVLIGVSGGADSMLLLHYFLSVRDPWDLTVCAAHVEHGIRGSDSVADADFVRSFCERHHVLYYQKNIHAPQEAAAAGQGLEEYARHARYAFFHSIDCDKIVTAHNLSDNVETVLFHFARGASLKGLCGIPPVRGKIIRPLLKVSSDDVRAYCAAHQIAYRQDSTNTDMRYTRNYIRSVLVPAFEKINPSFEKAANRLIESACADEAYLSARGAVALSQAAQDGALDCNSLQTFSPPEIRRALIQYCSGFDIQLDTIHLDAVTRLVFESGKVQLPKGFYAVSDGARLTVRCAEKQPEPPNVRFETHVVSVKKFLNIRKLSQIKIDFYCDYDKISGNIVFRARMAGDRIAPAGRGCTKTLKKLLNEMHMPVSQRGNRMVIADDDGVIGLVGYCCDERVKTDAQTRRVYFVTVHTED